MAYRRRTYKRKRSYPRRSYRRSKGYRGRRRYKRSSRAIRQPGIAFAKSQLVKLRYCQQVTLNPTAGQGAYIVYSANSLWSPNVGASGSTGTSVAHQPYGFDQWAGIYNEYVVVGSKIKIQAIAPNTSNPGVSGIISILLSDSPNPYTTAGSTGITTLMETGRAVYKQLGITNAQMSARLSKSFSAKRFWNLQSIKDNVDRIGSSDVASPAEQAYFHVQFCTNDTTATTSAGPLVWVTIDYIALFVGPADLSAS